MKTCSFEGCDNTVQAKNLCQGHYMQQWKGQPLRPLRTRNDPAALCGFDGCDKPVKTKNLCKGHYTQLLRGQRLRPLFESIQRDRIEWLLNEKDKPCTDCGGKFPSECMDFDHIPERGEKLFSLGISSIRYRSWNQIFIERVKCELVCANCHRTRTNIRRHENPRGCSVEGCPNKHKAQGFCSPHYSENRRKKELNENVS